MPVTYVIGDVAGVVESPVYAILKMNKALARARHARVRRNGWQARNLQRRSSHSPIAAGDEMGRRMANHDRSLPRSRHRVRRGARADLRADGRLVPFISHAAHRDGGDSVFARRHSARRTDCSARSSTATSMIGFMAGAGIVVRNSIILVDFIEQRLR